MPATLKASRGMPIATYRLQLNRDFDFLAVAGLVPYLHDLGITHLYSSPIFRARTGSRHGYDVTDPTALNPEMGSEAAFRVLVLELKARGMGLLVDIVPNHMAASSENPHWMDVLAQGEESPSARLFDIHWRDHKLILPILGDIYGRVLERGEIRIEEGEDGYYARYYEHRLPVRLDAWQQRALEGVEPSPINLLHAILERQPYRLAHWRMASEVNPYRRFFDINDLVGVRVEDEEVHAQTHRLLLSLVEAGAVSGVRIDHIDGLADPKGYLLRLRDELDQAGAAAGRRPYVVVEKVLVGPERLRHEWPVDGTTGYDFLSVLGGLFLDPAGVRAMEGTFARFAGSESTFENVARGKKLAALQSLFKGEHRDLVSLLGMIARDDVMARDIPIDRLSEGLAEVTASLPVYRTYIEGVQGSGEDNRVIQDGLARAKLARPDLDREVFSFLARLFLRESPQLDLEDETLALFFQRWQQLTGPLTAKGVEDTALFAHPPVIALNEVGRGMEAPTLEGFHAFCLERREAWPHSLSATSTHDTKWSEDVRARAFVLTEMAEEWERCLQRWSRRNEDKKTLVGTVKAPDASEEALIYQAMLAAWPLQSSEIGRFRLRLLAFVLKAMREAKAHTTWTAINPRWERAVQTFVDALFADREFMAEFYPLQRHVAYFGAINSLSQVLVKVTAPGVPDLYQGQELWDFSLVDPDNRRPVDFAARKRALDVLKEPPPLEDLLTSWQDGRIKMYLTKQVLAFRHAHARLFQEGEYIPLTLQGPEPHHAAAFARRMDGQWAVIVVPRLLARLGPAEGPLAVPPLPVDQAVVLPGGAPAVWRNALTGERLEAREGLPVTALLRKFPAALVAAG